jgi:hypothetical protein
LLQFRFELDESEQAKFTQQLSHIQNSQALTTLINVLLNKESQLEDFIGQLSTYLTASVSE